MKVVLTTLLALLAGCDVGYVPAAGPDSNTGSNVGGGSGEVAMGQCLPTNSNQPAGNHYPGMDCLGCHQGQSAGAPTFTIAGTLFATGSTPIAGATILITDSNNNSFQLVTASNGNFYTGSAVALPLTALGVSDCAADPMGHFMAAEMPVSSTPAMGIAAGSGGAGCNQCHVAGQDAPPMHLP
jgi:hypothetical protein